MASSDQSRAAPTPLSEQFANSVPHILASLKALEEKASALQLENDRLKEEIDVLRLKERESLQKLEINILKHDLDASNEKLKMALTELQEQKRIVVEVENLQEDRWEDSAFGHEEFAS